MLVGACLVLLAFKVFLAFKLDLYSDEIFYWLASTRLAPAYSDLPFMTSLLVWLGSHLDANNSFAVRSLFLAMGTCLPLLVYWIARPVTDQSRALLSALFSLCIPLGGFLGLLAVPDVPLVFFGLLSIGLFQRALASNALPYWVLLGLCVAAGLCTHYRFVLYPCAALLFLVLHQPARTQFRNPRLWLAMVIASVGLLPILWFNLSNQMSSASFYLIERHPWTFREAGLLHIFKQAGLVTPPLYALLLFTLWQMLKQARSGHGSAKLLLCLALVNILVYMVLAPWTDPTSTTLHWPLSGYFPILVYVPAALERIFWWLRSRYSLRSSRLILVAVPIIGFAGTLTGLLGIGSQAYQEPIQQIVGRGLLSNKMAGWREFAEHTRQLLIAEFRQEPPILVTDNYYTAAQLAFAGVTDSPKTIDIDKAIRDGRSVQLRLWNMDQATLAEHAGWLVLFISEDSSMNILDRIEVVRRMCLITEDMHHLDRLSLFNGDKQFTYYSAQISHPDDEQTYLEDPCPYPPRAWIDPPVAGETLSGTFHVEGWAFKEDIGIESVRLMLDGEEVAVTNYGIARPDVAAAENVSTDPNTPFLGYTLDFDTTRFPNSDYVLAVKLIDERGVEEIYGERPVVIRN